MTQNALVGSVIAGKYAIVRVVGTGGMGAVYEARHLELGKPVAIKVIDPRHATSGDAVERFRREARAASMVRSEHIVEVFDVGHDPNAGFFMVMELLDGEDLSARIEREKKIPPREAATIGVQVARALAKAHAAGVVHRDLKPANLFLTHHEDGSLLVKVLDFGVSKLLMDALGGAPVPLTALGAMIGSPRYMSPEQARGEPVDARTDLWSLGAVLYEILSGAWPYNDALQILLAAPRPLAEIAPWVPAPIAAVVHLLVVHDRTARLSDPNVVARMLLEAVGSTPSADRLIRQSDVNALAKTAAATESGAFDATLPLAGAATTTTPATRENAIELPRSNAAVVIAALVAAFGLVALGALGFTAFHAHGVSTNASSSPSAIVNVSISSPLISAPATPPTIAVLASASASAAPSASVSSAPVASAPPSSRSRHAASPTPSTSTPATTIASSGVRATTPPSASSGVTTEY